MPLFGFIENGVSRIQTSAMKFIYEEAQSYSRNYPLIITAAVEAVIADLKSKVNSTSVSLSSPQLRNIDKIVNPWYDGIAASVRDIEKTAYFDFSNLFLEGTKKLFDVTYKYTNPKNLPKQMSPDTAASFDLGSDAMLPAKEAAEEGLPQIVLVLAEGGISAEFELFLNEMFDAGLDAQNAIRTFGANDVARIKSIFIEGVKRGESYRTIRNRIIGNILSDTAGAARRKVVGYNIQRIMRTVHQRAAIAASFSQGRRNPYIQGFIRHTGPRPCPACMALDGKRYETWQQFRDHPNGMCTVTPIIPSIDVIESKTQLSPEARRVWRENTVYRKNERYKFREMSAEQQRSVVDNDKLYNFWLKEDFPLERFASYRGGGASGFFEKATYVQLLSKIRDLGGRSYPKISYSTKYAYDKLNRTLDPIDRAIAGRRALLKQPSTSRFIHGIALYEKDPDLSLLPVEVLSLIKEITAGYSYNKLSDLPWYVYNDAQRAIGLGVRKTSNGVIYYVS